MNMCDCKPIELQDVQPGDIVHHARMACQLLNYYLAIARYGDVQDHKGLKTKGVYFATLGRERLYWIDQDGHTRPWIIEQRQHSYANQLVLVERLT